MRVLAASAAAVAIAVGLPGASLGRGAVSPQCRAAGAISAYCVTWQTTPSFPDETSLSVEINGTGSIFAFSFALSGRTVYSVSGNTSCRAQSSRVLCDNLGLQLGYGQSAGVQIKTITALAPGTIGSLTLYAGTSPGTPQPAQPVTLQAAPGTTQPVPKPAYEAKLSKAEAEALACRREFLIAIATLVTPILDAERRKAEFKAEVESWSPSPTVALEDIEDAAKSTPAADEAKLVRAEHDLHEVVDTVTGIKMELTTKPAEPFDPAKAARELRDAEQEADAAAKLTEQVM